MVEYNLARVRRSALKLGVVAAILFPTFITAALLFRACSEFLATS